MDPMTFRVSAEEIKDCRMKYYILTTEWMSIILTCGSGKIFTIDYLQDVIPCDLILDHPVLCLLHAQLHTLQR